MRLVRSPRGGMGMLVGLCAVLLTACAGFSSGGAVSATATQAPIFATLTALPDLRTPSVGTGAATPPSVEAFCLSQQSLASIIGETMTPDFTTGTHGQSTTCGYTGASGDTCEFTVTAWSDAQSARGDYNNLMSAATQVGGSVQPVSGIGDAAFYWVNEDVTVLKGSFDFLAKCYFLPPRQQVVDEQVDLKIARLLVAKL